MSRPAGEWTSQYELSHSLVGKIWDVERGAFISKETLGARLSEADVVLLGEIHDNPDHHTRQAELLAASGAETLIMEQVDRGQEEALREFMESKSMDSAALAKALDWEASGWPAFSNYQAIVEVALKNNLFMIPGNLSRQDVRDLMQQDMRALKVSGVQTVSKVDLEVEDKMKDDIVKGHCGLIKKEMTDPMVRVQWARDEFMTDQIIESTEEGGVALVAGNGHIQDRYAVAYHLETKAPKLEAIAVALVEVNPEEIKPSEYNEGYDFIWFTPVFNTTDHCEELRKRFKKSK